MSKHNIRLKDIAEELRALASHLFPRAWINKPDYWGRNENESIFELAKN